MALNKCSVCGRTARYHVEVETGLTPTFTGTPDTYFCAEHVLTAMAVDGNAVKGIAVYGEARTIDAGSTAANDTFTDGKLKY